jgi:cation diffusion facilitator CzcD-associated flavoprotein CzcO
VALEAGGSSPLAHPLVPVPNPDDADDHPPRVAEVREVVDAKAIVVGAGFAGVGAGVRLLQAGESDFVILERADQLGGTWRDNQYPGCRCDVPSHLYSYSFAPNPDWPQTYAGQEDIWDYMRATAERFGVLPHIRFAHDVLEARWDGVGHWVLTTDRGAYRCHYLIAATGSLAEPRTPSIAGAGRFSGASLHSARWDATQRFDGLRVAVIGTGASGVQIVPAIQPAVAHLSVFQRTPGWVLPHPVRRIHAWERRLFRFAPFLQRLVRAAIYWQREVVVVSAFTKYDGLRAFLERQVRRHLARQVPDPELRARLTPDYQLGCKRVLPSNDFYPALCQPNVELVTEPIARVESDGILTTDGRFHQLDAIVYATGFHVSDNPMGARIVGRESHLLAEAIAGELPCYLGTTFPYFPNFFMLSGPNTGTGHTSQIFMIESQLNYVLDALDLLEDDPGTVAEVLPSVAQAYADDLQRRMRRTVWSSGCASWYQNSSGRNVAMWPDYTLVYRRQTRRFDPTDYVIGRAPEPASSVSAT